MTETEFQPEPRELGPDRFQRRRAAREKRGVLRALGAGVVLLALVAGLPALLLWLDGAPPVPTSVPTREDLTRAIGPDELVTVMVAVAWLAWLQFTVCVLVELRSAASGVGLPAKVPFSGPSQRFARALVGAVLLAATAVGPATAAPASGAPAGPVAAEAVAVAAPAIAASASGTDEDAEFPAAALEAAEQGRVGYVLGDTVLDPTDGAQLVDRKVYRVQPPEGRYHDNLWDIAERHLGDGRRYKEIFELNRGRTQPDGHELSLARLIYPDWLLVMPEDAEGVDRVTAVTAEPEPVPDAEPRPTLEAQPLGEHEGDLSGAVGTPAVDGAGAPVGSHRAGAGAVGEPEAEEAERAGLPQGVVAGGLLAACLLALVELARRRGRVPEPGDAAVESEVVLRIGADPDRAAWLDEALRTLAAACREQGRSLPPVYAAVVDGSGVELMLAPAVADPPAPWHAWADGRRWRLERRDGKALPPHGPVPAPFPGLVSLGQDAAGRDVLIDLEAAGGPVAVTGDPTCSYETVTAMAAELATNPWSGQLRVTGTDLPLEMADLGPSRFQRMDDVSPLLADLEAKRSGQQGDDVLSGRLDPAGAGVSVPEYVVLGARPDTETTLRLGAVTAGPQRHPLGVVCAGEFPGARWRMEVDAVGNLALPALGLTVRANRLSAAAVASVASLAAPDMTTAPGPTQHEAWLPDVRPEVPDAPVEAEPARLATVPVRVFVLGPAEVQAPGPVEEDRRSLATEIVIYLALHREEVHPTVLASAIWPGGVTGGVRDAAIDRVRDWLGSDPEGAPYLLTASDGRLRLSPDVVVDWEVVQTLLRRSRVAPDVREEIDLLRRALRVARGPVLAERPAGRYSWIARIRLDRVASDLLVDAAHRLSMLCLDGGDTGMGGAAARAGIRVRPGEQLLWRDLLRVEHERGGRERVLDVADELTTALGGLGIATLEPETMALLEELLPDEGVREQHLA